MVVEKQVAIIYCGTKGLLMDVPVESIKDFEIEYLHFLETKHKDVLDNLRAGKLLDEDLKVLEQVAKDFSQKYTKKA